MPLSPQRPSLYPIPGHASPQDVEIDMCDDFDADEGSSSSPPTPQSLHQDGTGNDDEIEYIADIYGGELSDEHKALVSEDSRDSAMKSAMKNWNNKIFDLLFGLVHSEGAPQDFTCFKCEKTIHVWSINSSPGDSKKCEEVLRCFDCGRGFFFCAVCGLKEHTQRHQTHKVEAWVPVQHGIDGDSNSPLVHPCSRRWEQVINVREKLEQYLEVSREEQEQQQQSSPSIHINPSSSPLSAGPSEYGCGCAWQFTHSAVVYDPFGLSKHHTEVPYKSCQDHRARTLVTLGYWPMTPIKPEVVVPLKAMVLLYRQRIPLVGVDLLSVVC